MNKKMYVDVTEVCEDWGVSRAQGYKIIKQLSERMLAINSNLIVFPVRQTESPTRRTVMYRLHIYYITAS